MNHQDQIVAHLRAGQVDKAEATFADLRSVRKEQLRSNEDFLNQVKWYLTTEETMQWALDNGLAHAGKNLAMVTLSQWQRKFVEGVRAEFALKTDGISEEAIQAIMDHKTALAIRLLYMATGGDTDVFNQVIRRGLVEGSCAWMDPRYGDRIVKFEKTFVFALLDQHRVWRNDSNVLMTIQRCIMRSNDEQYMHDIRGDGEYKPVKSSLTRFLVYEWLKKQLCAPQDVDDETRFLATSWFALRKALFWSPSSPHPKTSRYHILRLVTHMCKWNAAAMDAVNPLDGLDDTLLMEMVKYGVWFRESDGDSMEYQLTLLNWMLTCGHFDVRVKDKSGQTLLHVIMKNAGKVTERNKESMHMLVHTCLALGLSMDEEDEDGWTPWWNLLAHGVKSVAGACMWLDIARGASTNVPEDTSPEGLNSVAYLVQVYVRSHALEPYTVCKSESGNWNQGIYHLSRVLKMYWLGGARTKYKATELSTSLLLQWSSGHPAPVASLILGTRQPGPERASDSVFRTMRCLMTIIDDADVASISKQDRRMTDPFMSLRLRKSQVLQKKHEERTVPVRVGGKRKR
jgi:hypothetical protein